MAIGISGVTPTLAVTDLKRAKDFYGGVLGLEELKGEPMEEGGAVYSVGECRLLIYERPQPSGSTATACTFSVEDMEKTVAELRGKGVKFEEYDLPEMGIKTENGVARMEGGFNGAWFKDPSGNIIAIDDSFAVESRRGKPEQAQPAPH